MRLLILFLALLLAPQPSTASSVTELCPSPSIRPRAADFSPGGIILTAFDRTNLWVYHIDRNARWPLPETRPCGSNCRLSPDALWITYVDPRSGAIGKMRLDDTGRTRLADYASDLQWWSADALLIWTPGRQAYLRPEANDSREYLNVEEVVQVQPGGRWGLRMQPMGDGFSRALINLETRGLAGIAEQSIDLGEDLPYYNAAAWSPLGDAFAYVAPSMVDPQTGARGSELFIVGMDDQTPRPLTDLGAAFGPVRINGRSATNLRWSPDGRFIAFWVAPLTGPDPEAGVSDARLHVIDARTGDLRAYCGFTTAEHTPDPPRLIWSPDSSHVAFGGNIPGDNRGYLLLALDIETGIFTELSEGIFPALGTADPIAWGRLP